MPEWATKVVDSAAQQAPLFVVGLIFSGVIIWKLMALIRDIHIQTVAERQAVMDQIERIADNAHKKAAESASKNSEAILLMERAVSRMEVIIGQLNK